MPFRTDPDWPDGLREQFRAADSISVFENRYYGPYDTLLRHCFDYSYNFLVALQAPVERESKSIVDFITFLVVRDRASRPVLLLEIKPEYWKDSASRRRDADKQIRARLEELYESSAISKLYGLSALGQSVRIYTIDRGTGLVTPPFAPLPGANYAPPPQYLEGQWNCNILGQDGFSALQDIIADIRQQTAL